MADVTLPSLLAFLVSNFHSLVNIKLDASNYLLWRIQVVNVMDANGFLGYLDGSTPIPSVKIQDATGIEVDNPTFKLWKLIDSQLLSCLTASLSQSTLPYVLGLQQAKQAWDSLSTRYNYLSDSHAQELRTQLYNHTKVSTIEVYIDKIKEISQKHAATGDDELVFHTLRGLPPVFNGLKTVVRAFSARGAKLSFDEVVALLNSEDVQLLQNSVTDLDKSTVLVTTQFNPSSQQSGSSTGDTTTVMQSTGGIVGHVQYGFGQPMPSFNNFYPQMQQFSGNFKNGQRGRGGEGSRYPREPCTICGKTNHVTAYCYLRPTYPSMSMPQPPQSFPPQNYYNNADMSMPQPPQSFPPQSFPSQPPQSYPRNMSIPRQFGGFTSGQHVSSSQLPQVHYAAYTGTENMTGSSSLGPYGFVNSDLPYYGPSGQSNMSGFFSGNNGGPNPSGGTSAFACLASPHPPLHALDPSGSQPWFFDSGATNHVTNNLMKISHPQPSHSSQGGVMVGNGSSLQVTHTRSGVLPTPITNFQLSHVLHTPLISHNLIYVHKFAQDNNCLLIFDSSGLVIQDKTSLKILYKGPCHRCLYPILSCSKESSVEVNYASALVSDSKSSTTMLWYQKLGHPCSNMCASLIKQYALPVKSSHIENCVCCNMAKSHKLPFPCSETHSTEPFQLVHLDVWGPSPVPSNKGYRYYLLAIDDFSRFSWLFPLHYKSEVKHKISEFKAYVQT